MTLESQKQECFCLEKAFLQSSDEKLEQMMMAIAGIGASIFLHVLQMVNATTCSVPCGRDNGGITSAQRGPSKRGDAPLRVPRLQPSYLPTTM